MDFRALAERCAPAAHHSTLAAIAGVESSFNPFAIGVVGNRLQRQPSSKEEAIATAKALERSGVNFSVGLGQVNRYNLAEYHLDYAAAFDPCSNLAAASRILAACFAKASSRFPESQVALHAALSCYYSGNFETGFRADVPGLPSYVQRVIDGAAKSVEPSRDVISSSGIATGRAVRVSSHDAALVVDDDSASVYRNPFRNNAQLVR